MHSGDKNRKNSKGSAVDSAIIIGRNPVLEALNSDQVIDTIYINGEGGTLSKILAIAIQKGIVVKKVSAQKLASLCVNANSESTNHQGVVATIACAEYSSIDRMFEFAKEKDVPPFIIIADGIEDTHNLGAIIRSAEAAGAHGLIIPKRRSASLNATVYKTSAGAASVLPIARVANISDAIEQLKQRGMWIYGADMDGEQWDTVNYDGNVAIVIGSEGRGISRLVKEKCDFLVSLPMLGRINSLNASVAAGIIMYEVVRQRIKTH